MAGPWEKYAQQPAASGSKPWERYRKAEPAPQQPSSPEGDTFQRATILPLGRDTETGDLSLAVPGFIKGATEAVGRAVAAPGRAMAGDLPVMGEDGRTSPDAIAEATNMAAIAAPASAGRNMMRPTPPVREGMEVAAAGQRLGVRVPRAATSDRMSVQQAGKTVSNVPLAATPLRRASQGAIDDLGRAADRVQEGFGSGSPPRAGNDLRQNITTYSTKTLPKRVSDEYEAVDSLITQNVLTPLENTAKTVLDITSRRENARIGSSPAVARVRGALGAEGGLNYQGIKDLRTSIGEILDDPNKLVASRVPEAELRRIYGSLTADLKNAVQRSGGDRAVQAFERANTLAAKTANERKALSRILGQDASDERIFDRITAMAGTNTRANQVGLRRVRAAVSDDTWNEMASGVIAKLGRDADGNFSPDRFITGYGRLSKEGKSALFGGKGELASSLDDIATVSRRFKQLNQFANPSGTAQNVIGPGLAVSAVSAPMTTIASVAGARVMSSLLARPTSARALAAYARAYERQATKPSPQSAKALENSARAVAAFIANESGDRAMAGQIFPSISRVGQVPAEEGNEDPRRAERQDRRVPDQPRMLAPNEL